MASEQFEFIDCATLNIAYQQNGLAAVSFTVVSTEEIAGVTPFRDYTDLTFGGLSFKGFITGLTVQVIPGSIPSVFEHRFSLVATGCSTDCPRGGMRPT
jgi:hypothetical protein